MGVHDGRRARKKEQFLAHGLDAFSDHEALELLLYYALPRVDTNALAHRLIERFGSLDAVFCAPLNELEAVEGVGRSAATLLTLVLPLARRARTVSARQPVILADTEAAGRFFVELFFGLREERVYLACLDAKGKLLRCTAVSDGSADTATLNLRRIVELAFQSNASAVILSHNHPSGVALPSQDDNESTLAAWDALRRIGIRLIDHIIVADDDFVSLRDNGLLPPQ
ncbi:MAG: DNA repair protein RadC [Oscillospiraceae bacterium]|nr:DNA repair protein RadC [Oscillospiraceae bacterium]